MRYVLWQPRAHSRNSVRYFALVLHFPQTYQCENPFCNISRETCAFWQQNKFGTEKSSNSKESSEHFPKSKAESKTRQNWLPIWHNFFLLTKNYFKIIIFEKLRISRVIPWKSPPFPKNLRVQNRLKITKTNSQGIMFVIISCQRAFKNYFDSLSAPFGTSWAPEAERPRELVPDSFRHFGPKGPQMTPVAGTERGVLYILASQRAQKVRTWRGSYSPKGMFPPSMMTS